VLDVPLQVKEINDVADIEAGMHFSIALKNDGTVWAWGRNDYGQLGNDEVTDTSTPIMVPGLASIKSIAAGAHHVIAVDSDGAFWMWGWDFAKNVKFALPHKEGGLRGITQAAGGIHFTSVLKGN
jgi:alpha-tubulin suppressor-like RCC1 family protein